MSVKFPMSRTPEQWREMACSSRQRSLDSFERSDTDGFLSQWASDTMSGLYHLCADVAEKGGIVEMDWPFEDGQPVAKWRWVQTRYGSSILIPGEAYGDGRFWNPSHAKKGATRLARDKAKGFTWGTVKVEVVCKLAGGGHALYPITEPKIGAAVEVVSALSDRYEDEVSSAA